MNNELLSRTFTMKRTFDAPRQLVWDTWTQPKHLANWWGRGADMNIEEHDFSEGGVWKFSMPMPNGGTFVSEGIYSEIVPIEKIVSSAEFKPMTEGVIIMAMFEDAGDKTNFTFSVVHPTQEYAEQQTQMGIESGWGSVFAVLENYISTL